MRYFPHRLSLFIQSSSRREVKRQKINLSDIGNASWVVVEKSNSTTLSDFARENGKKRNFKWMKWRSEFSASSKQFRPFFIWNHKEKRKKNLRPSFSHNLLMESDSEDIVLELSPVRGEKCKSNYWWAHVWKLQVKDQRHKNQLKDAQSRDDSNQTKRSTFSHLRSCESER